ncbi:MAG: tRNA(Met) cytidine acetyltransferase TmcA [Endozoicomonas sp.]
MKASIISNHRSLLVLSGSMGWCHSRVKQVLTGSLAGSRLWVGESPESDIPVSKAGKARQWLGRELDLLVFDAHCGFDVDAFGALSGTVRGGGLLVLLTPDLKDWKGFDDPEHRRMAVYPEPENVVTGRYLARLSSLIREYKELTFISENGNSDWQKVSPSTESSSIDDRICRTADQLSAVNAVKRVATGHRRRPLVLTADRGRGKSAALGIAAAQLLQGENTVERIIVTAPSMASAEVIFRHAESLLDNCESSAGPVNWEGKVLAFRAPDELAESGEDCDLVLVDEAAALPAPLLEKLLRAHSRIVFATTIHGYEGTGRGFAVRFRKTLDGITPRWRPLHISEPVRWADKDPLEAFVFKALMLDSSAAEIERLESVSADQCELVRIDRDELVQDDIMLRELFGLLVLAHYRTRPFDLRHMLDGPNIEVYGCLYQGRVVATLLAAREGGIEEEMVEPIWLGQRRVRGHLIPQSLSNHVGIPEAVTRKGLRILRIAVHPSIQRKGVGRLLVDYVANQSGARQFDYIGSSFGATADLLHFWGDCGFQPVRVGLTREASSGCHSLMVLKPLAESGERLVREASNRFLDNFLLQLPGALVDLAPEIVVLLFQGSHFHPSELTLSDRRDIYSFSFGNRLYESCLASLKKYLLFILGDKEEVATYVQEDLDFLIMKILQNRNWSEIVCYCGFQGKNAAMNRLRKIF